jgi:hypothetical protein
MANGNRDTINRKNSNAASVSAPCRTESRNSRDKIAIMWSPLSIRRVACHAVLTSATELVLATARRRSLRPSTSSPGPDPVICRGTVLMEMAGSEPA